MFLCLINKRVGKKGEQLSLLLVKQNKTKQNQKTVPKGWCNKLGLLWTQS
jgi:hypothetical protein